MIGTNNRNMKGSGFTNINRVLDANKGNQLGSTVSNQVQTQANQVRSNVQDSQKKFETEAQKNRLDSDDNKNVRDNVIGRFGDDKKDEQQQSGSNNQEPAQPQNTQSGNLAGTQEVANQVAQNQAPQSGAEKQPLVSNDEVSRFQQILNGQYAGPNQLEGLQGLMGKAQNTQQLGELTRDAGGRQELLRRFVGGGDYTQGQQRLDGMLLGTDPTALNQTRRETQGLLRSVSDANSMAGSTAVDLQNRAQAFKDETRGQLEQTYNPLSGQLDTRVQELQAIEDNRQNLLNSILGKNQDESNQLGRQQQIQQSFQQAVDAGFINQDQMNSLLGDSGLIQRGGIFGLDRDTLIRQAFEGGDVTGRAAQNINRTGVADDAQIEKMSALERLMGRSGMDAEFGQPIENRYQQGDIGMNMNKVEQTVTGLEQQKQQSVANINDILKKATTVKPGMFGGSYVELSGQAKTDALAQLDQFSRQYTNHPDVMQQIEQARHAILNPPKTKKGSGVNMSGTF